MKQHRLKNYLKLGILLFGISLFVINCQTDDYTFDANKNINAKTVSFDEAKAFFESQKDNNLFAKRSSSNELILNPDWNSLEHSDLTYTEAQLTKANTGVNRTGNFSSKLLFINIDNQIQSIILTTWVTGYDDYGDILDAKIYFNDYDGNFIDAYEIENGIFTNKLVPSPNVQTASMLTFLQDDQFDPDCWNTDNLPDDGQLGEVDLGTINTVQDGGSSGGAGGFTSLPGGTYGGYINGGVSAGGGRPNTSGPGGGGITRGGIDNGAATILINPIGRTDALDQNTQNHLNALNQFTGHDQIKGKINELQGKLNYSEEFGYQFTENGSNYSIIAGTPDNTTGGIGFPDAQDETVLEMHTHHVNLDPVFSADDVFNTLKLYNATSNSNATTILITTPTKLYALRINDATLANTFFNNYNSEQGKIDLNIEYDDFVIERAQWACNGTCTDVQYEIYINYYLNQFLQLMDSGLILFAGFENADGTFTWNPIN